MSWAFAQSVVSKPTARFVLLGLANHAGPDGTAAFPSVATLCEYTGLSERAVRSNLRELEALGVIRRCDPAIVAAHVSRADRRPLGYDLVLYPQRGAVDAPRESDGGQDVPPAEGHGGQEVPERGAGAAPEPSLNRKTTTHGFRVGDDGDPQPVDEGSLASRAITAAVEHAASQAAGEVRNPAAYRGRVALSLDEDGTIDRIRDLASRYDRAPPEMLAHAATGGDARNLAHYRTETP